MRLPEAQIRELADECYGALALPEAARCQPQFCIGTIGLLGSGKSTALRALSQHIPVVTHAGDEIRRTMINRGLPVRGTDVIRENVIGIGRQVSERLRRNGYNIAHDASMADPAVRHIFHQDNNAMSIQEIWIHIDPPEKYILEKLCTYKHDWLYDDAEEAIRDYVRYKEIYRRNLPEIEALPFVYTFDPSRTDLESQAVEAALAIKQTFPALDVALGQLSINND